jgi:predicted nucleic acid-binding protein
MKRIYFLDSSVAIKLAAEKNEKNWERIRSIFPAGGSFHMTTFCFYETLRRFKSKLRTLKKSEPTNSALQKYLGSSSLFLHYVSRGRIELDDEFRLTDNGTMQKCGRLAKKHDLDLSDALQILTVKDGRFRKLTPTLVTDDKDLAAAAKIENILVWFLREQPLPPESPITE